MTTSGPKEYLEGHADFAAYIAINPDLEIFRRFTRLSARNLLYLQSELASLESWLDDFDREDEQKVLQASREENMDISLRTRNWETFVLLAATDPKRSPSEEEKRQASKMRQVMKLRRVLAEYQDALVRQNACLSLQSPGKGALKAFSEWYLRKQPLLNQEKNMLEDTQDLVCLKRADDTDRLSRMLRENIGFLLGYFFEEAHHYPSSWGRIFRFRENHVERLTAAISVFIAALLLVGSIVALYFEQTPAVRLSLLRVELFAATAAYAAVLVVFVSGSFDT